MSNTDSFFMEQALERHEALSKKRSVDTNLANILIGLLEANPELLMTVQDHTIPASNGLGFEQEIQDKVVDLILDEDWQGLFSLSDHAFMEF